jgi:Ca2+-binding RTX toxin-like protein
LPILQRHGAQIDTPERFFLIGYVDTVFLSNRLFNVRKRSFMSYEWIATPTYWNSYLNNYIEGTRFRFDQGQFYADASLITTPFDINPIYGVTITQNDFAYYIYQFPLLSAASSALSQNFIGNVSGTQFNDTFNFTGGPFGQYSPLARFNIDAGDGNDYIGLGGDYYSFGFVSAGNGNDTVDGSALSDTLLGGDGDDFIRGWGGNDVIDGGDGNDTVSVYNEASTYPPNSYTGSGAASGGAGHDILLGAGGNDYLFGDAGNDSIYGRNGNDVLNGGTGADYLSGDAGNDSLYGGDGTDLLIGGAGWDEVTGGAGADVFGFRADSQRDYITDFDVGVDHVRIDTSLASDFAALDAMTSFYNDGNWGIVEFADGQVIALWQTDMALANVSWFQFGFV